ncbi:hypothetical protein LOK49_LG13G02228 [Camellia lanceoleosa]|uniref:Uncharacterized protein n=1 Tax=Camellia lanceoleosa TaxID=1840588 RepID=A0ACC0FG13_9ERIC|nr:hypothetical protein LOK49_LG13G02228 [Camellia lanceoleosa]
MSAVGVFGSGWWSRVVGVAAWVFFCRQWVCLVGGVGSSLGVAAAYEWVVRAAVACLILAAVVCWVRSRSRGGMGVVAAEEWPWQRRCGVNLCFLLDVLSDNNGKVFCTRVVVTVRSASGLLVFACIRSASIGKFASAAAFTSTGYSAAGFFFYRML